MMEYGDVIMKRCDFMGSKTVQSGFLFQNMEYHACISSELVGD
jgi:hypothetical protein